MTAWRSVTAQGGHGNDQCMRLVSLDVVCFSNPTLRTYMCLYVVCVCVCSRHFTVSEHSDLKVKGHKTVLLI